MNIQNDDEKFEKFLKQFRSRAPEPLRIGMQERPIRRPLIFGLATVAVIVVAASLTIHFHSKQMGTPDVQDGANVERLTNPEPLTIGTANALLAQAPSVKKVIDDMAFKSESRQLSKGKHSAFSVLGKESMKL